MFRKKSSYGSNSEKYRSSGFFKLLKVKKSFRSVNILRFEKEFQDFYAPTKNFFLFNCLTIMLQEGEHTGGIARQCLERIDQTFKLMRLSNQIVQNFET